MTKRHHTKLVHEGKYVAEVDVEIFDTGDGWSPYLSLEDAQKLDDVREALRENLTKGKTSRNILISKKPEGLNKNKKESM